MGELEVFFVCPFVFALVWFLVEFIWDKQMLLSTFLLAGNASCCVICIFCNITSWSRGEYLRLELYLLFSLQFPFHRLKPLKISQKLLLDLEAFRFLQDKEKARIPKYNEKKKGT